MSNRTVVLNTTKGEIQFELDEQNAPITTTNFAGLVEKGFYNGLKFHPYFTWETHCRALGFRSYLCD